MPLIQVKLYEDRLTDDTVERLLDELTDAFVEAIDDESIRDFTEVIVEGVQRDRWGVGGKTY